MYRGHIKTEHCSKTYRQRLRLQVFCAYAKGKGYLGFKGLDDASHASRLASSLSCLISDKAKMLPNAESLVSCGIAHINSKILPWKIKKIIPYLTASGLQSQSARVCSLCSTRTFFGSCFCRFHPHSDLHEID